jgi:hypothetical protein
MRASLSGVRSRVDRLALKLVSPQAAGCACCRGQGGHAEGRVPLGDETPNIQAETRCEACGRAIPLRYVTIGYDINMKPGNM